MCFGRLRFNGTTPHLRPHSRPAFQPNRLNLPTQPSTLPELPTLAPPIQPVAVQPTQPSDSRSELPDARAVTDAALDLYLNYQPAPRLRLDNTPLQQGFGAQKGFWKVYFSAPTGSGNRANYVGGIDNQLADAINQVQRTLDIAAFEFNDPVITAAVLAAKSTRGCGSHGGG